MAVLQSVTFAQTVSSIVIHGHQKTKEYIITREIQHPLQVVLDSVTAEADRNRIENLGIYSTVSWQALPLEDGTVALRYNVIESIRYFPILLPSYEEDSGWSMVYGGIVKNVRGRNETLVVGGLFGGVDAFGIEFNNPWLFGDHVSINLQTGRYYSDHLFLPYQKQVTSLEINFGRYFGYERRVSFGFEYEQKNYVNDSTRVMYNYFAPQGSVTFDTRDIYSDPSKGVYLFQTAQYYKYLNRDGWTLFWAQSYSAYTSPMRGKRKTTLGANLTITSTHGEQHKEIFLSSLGGAYSVRGWRVVTRTLFEGGEHRYRFDYYNAFTSLELRQTVIPRFAVEQLSPFGTLKSEFGLQAVCFIDAGVSGENWIDLTHSKMLVGVGIGLRIPVALVGNIRLDYGWSFYDGSAIETALHLALRQKF